MGFELNPCDLYAVSKIVNSSPYAITWHINNAKISHKDSDAVKSLIGDLERKFRKMPSISYESECDFLGMKLKFENKKV